MSDAEYRAAADFALELLAAKLPPEFSYHSLRHTRDDVLPAALRLADYHGIEDTDRELLRVAAAFHDVGYIDSPLDHELASARLAAQALPRFGLEARSIERIMGMILATRLPQSPRNLLEEILADADLDILGRPDFMERGEALRQELAVLGEPLPPEAWLVRQQSFLAEHSYFTAGARAMRSAGKQQNMVRITDRLVELTATGAAGC